MFVKDNLIKEMVEQYGKPLKKSFEFEVSLEELQRIKSSQKKGRNHDVTLYILKENKIVVIAKPFYPPNMYRAPSGGLNPDEDFYQGGYREAMEETGCEIKFEKFLLQTDVKFVCEEAKNIKDDDNKNLTFDKSHEVTWRSFVFQARYIDGDFNFTDTREISEVRMASLEEFESYSKIMRSMNIGGLHYRAALHDSVKNLLKF